MVSRKPAPAPAAGAESSQAPGSELVTAHQNQAPAVTPTGSTTKVEERVKSEKAHIALFFNDKPLQQQKGTKKEPAKKKGSVKNFISLTNKTDLKAKKIN